MENGVAGRKNCFTVAVDMDIYVWLISDLGQPRKYNISGIRIINDFTICGCVEDADILLLYTEDVLCFRSAFAALANLGYISDNIIIIIIIIIISSSFSLPIPLSRRIYPRFSSFLMQWVEWSQFAVDYFRI